MSGGSSSWTLKMYAKSQFWLRLLVATAVSLFVGATHAQFSASQGLIDFGAVEIGASTQPRSFTLTNVSSSEKILFLKVTADYCPSLPPAGCLEQRELDAASFHAEMDCGALIEQGQTCTVKVSFTPLAARQFIATIRLGNDVTGREVAVGLIGNGERRGTHVERRGYSKSMLTGGALYFNSFAARDMSGVKDGKIRIIAKEIKNLNKLRGSGPVQLQAVLSPKLVKDGEFSAPYIVVGVVNLDPLPPDGAHRNIDAVVDYRPPPTGDYYLYYVLAELEGPECDYDGFCVDDYVVFGDLSHYEGRSITEITSGIYFDVPAEVVEYYHAGFGHYFITPDTGEKVLLDLGQISGWTRTGESFPAWKTRPGETPVCRFFSDSFAPKSSHFYTPYGPECEALRQSTVWKNELTSFYVVGGGQNFDCRAGVPIYRLYNNGMGGAPNHRFTISYETREEMRASGWIFEGIIACSAPG